MHIAFFCVAATPGLRRGLFPKDEPLDERGLEATRARAPKLPRAEICWTSPATCAIQSAAAVGGSATPVAALRECDYGAWAGADLREVSTRHPSDYAAWLSDPAAAPHGGESVVALIARVGAWLDGIAAESQTALAITHASVIRAAVVHARTLPAADYARVAVPPLTLTVLRREAAGWIADKVAVALGA